MDFTVEQNRIYMQDEQGKLLAEVLFPDDESGTTVITSTFVDGSLKGQSIADKLLRSVVAELQAQNKQTKVQCSYAIKWFEAHPEYSNLLKKVE